MMERAVLGVGRSMILIGLVVAAGLAVACVRRAPAPPLIYGKPRASVPAAVVSPVGRWREQWGIPGHTDVEYHDEYVIAVEKGRPSLEAIEAGGPQRVDSISINGRRVEVVIHTSFDIRYQLVLDADGNALRGTATTPDKVIPVRWDRVRDGEDAVPVRRPRFEDP